MCAKSGYSREVRQSHHVIILLITEADCSVEKIEKIGRRVIFNLWSVKSNNYHLYVLPELYAAIVSKQM